MVTVFFIIAIQYWHSVKCSVSPPSSSHSSVVPFFPFDDKSKNIYFYSLYAHRCHYIPLCSDTPYLLTPFIHRLILNIVDYYFSVFRTLISWYSPFSRILERENEFSTLILQDLIFLQKMLILTRNLEERVETNSQITSFWSHDFETRFNH